MENRSNRGPDKGLAPLDNTLSGGGLSLERIILIAGLLVVSIICFRPSLELALYSDDLDFISRSRELIERSPSELFKVSTYHNFFRPVIYVVYYLSYRAFGLKPLGYHLTLLSTHLVISLVLYRLILLWASPRAPWSRALAALTAIYFFSHFRIHQAVFWYSGMKQVLSALFGLGAIYLLLRVIRGASRSWFAAFCVLLVSGLLTVESFLGFAVACTAMILFWPRQGSRPLPRLYAIAPLLLVTAYLLLFAVISISVQESRQIAVFWKPLPHILSHGWLMFFRSIFPYLFDPSQLNRVNAWFIKLFPLWLILSAALGLLIVLRGWPKAAILAALYAMLVAPYAIIFTPVLEGDRIFYESVAALCLCAGLLAVLLLDRPKGTPRWKAAALSALMIVLIILNAASYQRIIPSYRKIDKWNKKVCSFLVNYLNDHRPPQPVALYWIGYPYHGERVLATPKSFDKAAELYFGRTVIEEIEIAVWRMKTGSGQRFFINKPHLPPGKDDIIVYDDGRVLQVITREEAARIINSIKGRERF